MCMVDYEEVDHPVESVLDMELDFVLALLLFTALQLHLALSEGNDGLVDQVIILSIVPTHSAVLSALQ